MSRFYVYTHTNPITNKVFYVGSAKGNKNRAFDFNRRNDKWKQEVESFGGEKHIKVNIVKECIDGIDAQISEYELMRKLRDNGEAHCSMEHSDESVQKMSDSLKGLLIGDRNGMYGKTHKEDAINKIKKRRKEQGSTINRMKCELIFKDKIVEFDYVKDLYDYCKEIFGMSQSIVKNLLRTEDSYNGKYREAHGLKLKRIGKH